MEQKQSPRRSRLIDVAGVCAVAVCIVIGFAVISQWIQFESNPIGPSQVVTVSQIVPVYYPVIGALNYDNYIIQLNNGSTITIAAACSFPPDLHIGQTIQIFPTHAGWEYLSSDNC